MVRASSVQTPHFYDPGKRFFGHHYHCWRNRQSGFGNCFKC
nr:unnamed protein product [Callosobruchus chinensis]